MATLADIDMPAVRDHYLLRQRIHLRMREFLESESIRDFVSLALGIADGAGNYSASEHQSGPRILARARAEQDVFELAQEIDENDVVNRLPTIIYEKGIANLKISVGSEIAMMLKPNVHWIGNKRTVWAHLLVRHEMNEATANEALRLYYDGDDESPMAYNIWRDLYLAVGPDLVVLGQQGCLEAERQNVQPVTLRYLWPDAISTFLFDRYARH